MSIATVYSTVWNEEVRMPYFIKHYRERLPNCKIVIFDNKSTDKTIKIALDNDCTIVSFDTNNKVSDDALITNKNNCWRPWDCNTAPWQCWHHWTWTAQNEKSYLDKYPDVKAAVERGEFNSGMTHYFHFGNGRFVPNRPPSSTFGCDTEWCIVVDCDEFLDVNEKMLQNANFNIIRSSFYDMYGENNDIDAMVYGTACYGDKTICWKTKDFNSINYQHGAHLCDPQCVPGKSAIYSQDKINTFHMKWISYQYVMDRYRNFNTRDEENYKKGHGIQSHFSEAIQWEYYTNLKKYGVRAR
jgi:hypothetical protein